MATLIKILDKTKLQDKTVFAAPASEAPSLTTGLQAFYKLDDEVDSSGNGATLTNNGSVSFASGKLGNAAVFDGTNYFVSPLDTNGYGAFSFSFWFKTTDTNGQKAIIGNWNGSTNQFFCVTTGGDVAISAANSDGGSYEHRFGGESSYADDQWHHVVTSWNGTTATSYYDGNLIGNSGFTGIFPTSTSFLGIGTTEEGVGSQNFPGQIDAVGIWSRALSDSEVAALYNL